MVNFMGNLEGNKKQNSLWKLNKLLEAAPNLAGTTAELLVEDICFPFQVRLVCDAAQRICWQWLRSLRTSNQHQLLLCSLGV